MQESPNENVFFLSDTAAVNNVFLNGPFPASFYLFLSFQYTVDGKQMFNL